MHCSIQVIWFLVTLQSVGCTIIKKPNATYTIDAGEDLQLDCSTDLGEPMIWWFAKDGSNSKIEVTYGTEIGAVVKSRYKINSTSPGDFNLVILNADGDHAGRYSCHDDGGADQVGVSTQLWVRTAADPILHVIENSTTIELTIATSPYNYTALTEEPLSEGKSTVKVVVVVVVLLILVVVAGIVVFYVRRWHQKKTKKEVPIKEEIPLKTLNA